MNRRDFIFQSVSGLFILPSSLTYSRVWRSKLVTNQEETYFGCTSFAQLERIKRWVKFGVPDENGWVGMMPVFE